VTKEGGQLIIDFLLGAKKETVDYVKKVRYRDMRKRQLLADKYLAVNIVNRKVQKNRRYTRQFIQRCW
jgi:hypothetical protein